MNLETLRGVLEPGAHLRLTDGVEVTFEQWRRDRLVVHRISDSNVFTVSAGEVEKLVSARRLGFYESLEVLSRDSSENRNIGAMLASAKIMGKSSPLATYGSINAIPYLFQYTPLFALRRSPWGRVLVADETGLGKTVEAGIVMEELFRSNLVEDRIGDVLVIGPAGLYGEWLNKMARHFKRGVSRIIGKELLDRLGSRREPEKVDGIKFLSMDALPRMLDALQDLQKTKGIPNTHLFDLVVVDEAHHFKNPSSKRSRALHHLLGDPFVEEKSGEPVKIPKLLMLTATPLSTDLDNLVSYFDFLDPGVRALGGWERRKAAFQREHAQVVKIRRIANLAIRMREDPKDLECAHAFRDRLSPLRASMSLDDLGPEDEVSQALSTLEVFTTKPASIEEETLAEALLALDPWSDFIIRNTRKGVALDDQTQVIVENCPVHLTPSEAKQARIPTGHLHPFAEITLRQLVTSSIPAFFCRKALKVSKESQVQDFSLGFEDFGDEAGVDTTTVLKQLEVFPGDGLSLEALLTCNDSKYQALKASLGQFYGKRDQRAALLFTRYTTTGEYLYLRLKRDLAKEGVTVHFFHGGIKPSDRRTLIEELQEAGRPEYPILLVMTEVGQEGIDLQFATGVFHYDLPWNPMRIVQRNGRVHRIGQSSPVVYIHTFFVEGLADDRIARAIARRMKMIYETFGDLPEGLIGINPSHTLSSLIGKGIDWRIYNGLRGLELSDVEGRIGSDAARFEKQTATIEHNKARIEKIIEDEADSTRAWYPLLRDALHGSKGSLERVLRWDVVHLLEWATSEPRVGLRATPRKGGDYWDIAFDRYVLPEFAGMMSYAERRRLQEKGGLTAYLMPDEGGKKPNLSPSEILHMAHPIIVDLASRASSLLAPPIAFASSPFVKSLSCLVCLEISVEEPKGVSTESRWFLLEKKGKTWRPAGLLGDSARMNELLGKTGAWNPKWLAGKALDLGNEIKQALYELQDQIRLEVIERRRRALRRRSYRELRQWRPMAELKEQKVEDAELKLGLFRSRVRDEYPTLLAEYQQDDHADPADAIKRGESALRGQVTRAKREAAAARTRIADLKDTIIRSQSEGGEGIRVTMKDQDPLAFVLLCPE